MFEGPGADIALTIGISLYWAYWSAWVWWPLVLAGYWLGKRQIGTRTLMAFAATESLALSPFVQLLGK